MARTKSEEIPAKDVRESAFEMMIEFEAPKGFWDPDPEVLYHHPSQAYFWKGAVPRPQPEDWRNDWLMNLHSSLRAKDWPRENIDALYSYFEDPVGNPDEGAQLDPEVPPLVSFNIWIPGDWLVEHPTFFHDVDKLEKRGLSVKVKGKKKNFKFSHRLIGVRGPLNGEVWESGTFVVTPPREKPQAFEGGPRDWFPE